MVRYVESRARLLPFIDRPKKPNVLECCQYVQQAIRPGLVRTFQKDVSPGYSALDSQMLSLHLKKE